MRNTVSYSPQEISALCDYLSEERRSQAIAFLQYLCQQEQESKAQQAQQAFSQIDNLITGQDIWQNEQEMLTELAEFRRSRR
ncbi:MAG: hypothetical protein II131_03800 [Neisseriaceae bacterium]|nr:hypothetical protein [Neisseriaceae bacterium]